MIPQGTAIINASYFDGLTARVNAAVSCADLQKATDDVMASLSATKSAINDQIALLQPILALLSAPATNPGAIVTWITTYITNVLTPLVKPYATYATQLTELAVQLETLASAIAAKQVAFPSCSIDIPSV